MKKRIALWSIAGAAVLCLGACGGKKDGASGPVPSGTSTVAEESSDAAETTTDAADDSDAAIQDLDLDRYITPADHKNMEIHVTRPVVDDEIIESYINRELLDGLVKDRAVEDGDVVDIDYVGRKDGVAFDGGSAEGYRLVIGSGGFIPGFEEGLIGVMPGETVDLELTFPEDYRNKEMAGQEVVFTVTVNGIAYSVSYAQATSEDLERLGLDCGTKEELWELAEEASKERAKEQFAADCESAVIEELVAGTQVKSVPEHLVEEEVQGYIRYISFLTTDKYGMEIEDFVAQAYGLTFEEYKAQLTDMYTEIVKRYLAVEAVARQEGIEVTDEMLYERAAKEAKERGYDSAKELVDSVGYTTYRMYIVQELVLERLMETVTIVEEGSEAAPER